jgi:N-acylglucosamine 2-epimerase/mannose-6-phosphate isomerase
MHLLEAALAWHAARPDPRFRALAQELLALFAERLFDPRSGTLAEVYLDDWRRVPGAAGRVVEPGHHFEWAWLLVASERMLDRPVAERALPLVRFAERHGVDPASGATYGAVRDDGAPVARASRTWPNTERIKAHIALFELNGTDPRPALGSASAVLFDRYLAHAPRGTWKDQFDGDGRPVAATIPAATLYHLFVALTELLRVEPAVRALGRTDEGRPALLAGGNR